MHNATHKAPSTAILHALRAAVPALATTGLIIGLVAPRATPGILGLLALPPIVLAAWSGGLDGPARLRPLELIVLGFGAYLAANALWSVDWSEAYSKVFLFFLFAAAVHLCATSLSSMDDETIIRLRRAFIVSLCLGTLYLSIETIFDQPIKRWVTSVVPQLRPAKKHLEVQDGWVTSIALYVLNRNLALLTLIMWPGFLMIRSAFSPARARIIAGCLLVLTTIAVFSSEHETSMLAIIGASMVYVGMVLLPGLTRMIVLAGWLAATLLIVPIASMSYSAKLYQAEWIPKTGRNRIVLWGVTASKVRDAPVFGVGLTSTKPLDLEAAEKAAWPKDHPYPLRTGRHSHNIYMQTWYELGAVGAAMLMAIGVAILMAFRRLPGDVQPYLFASFASASVLGAFSWGMWQPWFMAAFGIWAIALVLSVEVSARTASGGQKAST